MNSIQYEELCRFFLAQTTGLPLDKIVSVRIPNPKRASLRPYSHQIDLYWETADDVCLYLNIANAKWRGSTKVTQNEVLLLQQVKQDLSAHKAVMITNTEFTSGAEAVAQDKGIALHVVRPAFDFSVLSTKNRALIRAKLVEMASTPAKPIFQHTVRYRAFDLVVSGSHSPIPQQTAAVPNVTRTVTGYTTRAVGSPSQKGGSFGGGKTGGSGSGSANRGGRGGFHTR